MKLASRHGILDDMHPQRPHWNSTHEVTSAFVRELEGIAWKVVTQQPTGPHPLEPFRFDGKYGRTGTEKSLTIGDGRAWPS